MLDTKTAVGWRGHELIDRDGDKIGTIEAIYLDHDTEQPEWVTVKTGLFGSRHTFVPIRDATSEGEIVRVPFEKSHVKDAPNVDPEQELSQEEERELYAHYGVDYGTDRSGSQLPEHGGGPGQEPMASAGDPTEPEHASTSTGATGTAGEGAPVAAQGDWQDAEERRREGDEDDDRGVEGSPTPDEGQRGVAVPGESDPDGAESSNLPERRPEQGVVETRAGDEAAGDEAQSGEPRLRLRRYVVEEVSVERDT